MLNNSRKTIKDVMYVPNLSTNLFSVKKLTDKGYCVTFSKNKCKIINSETNVCIASASQVNGIYRLDCVSNCSFSQNSESPSDVLLEEMQEQQSAYTAGIVPMNLWHK